MKLGGVLVKLGKVPSFEVGEKRVSRWQLLMSKTGFYAKMFFKRVCSSWLILLFQKRHQVQDVFDYLLEDVRHMAHAGQRLWHLHSSCIRLRIQCWLLIFADTALRGQSPDYNRRVW